MTLLFAVLLVFLLEPAAGGSAGMHSTLPGVPMDQFYPDHDLLSPICSFCAIPFLQCVHCMPPASYAAAEMLNTEPQHFQQPLPDIMQIARDLAPVIEFVNPYPLINEHLRDMNTNETTVQPMTVQAHVEDIYTPGDRLHNSKSRRTSRRQAPRPRGYPCEHEGCERIFDRACELNRHRKTHLNRSERPHKCDACHEAFLYPKDLARHQRKHVDQRSAQVTFFCHYPGCHDLNGFSRRDNLLRHQRKQHPAFIAAA